MQQFIIDVDTPAALGIVHAKQGDTDRAIQLILTRAGAPYIPPNGSAASVFYKTAGGEGNYSDGLTLTDNVLTVPLIEQMLDAPGCGAMCVVIFNAAGGQLGTWNLRVDVECVPGLDSGGATQWFTALNEYVGQTLANAQEAQAQADRAKEYADSITALTTDELDDLLARAEADAGSSDAA